VGFHPITFYSAWQAKTLWGNCAVVLGILVVAPFIVYKALVYILRWKFGRIAAGWVKELNVRAQHQAFVLKLSNLVFENPFQLMSMLSVSLLMATQTIFIV